MEKEIEKMNFLKVKCMEEKYTQIKKELIRKGFKPLNTTHSYSFDCKKSKRSNIPSKYTLYPYTITIYYQTSFDNRSINQYKSAA